MDEPQTHLTSRPVIDDRSLYEVIYATLTILILRAVTNLPCVLPCELKVNDFAIAVHGNASPFPKRNSRISARFEYYSGRYRESSNKPIRYRPSALRPDSSHTSRREQVYRTQDHLRTKEVRSKTHVCALQAA